MGKYKQVTDLVEGAVPEFTTMKVVPRGTPIFPDLLMTGQMRYARRLGANFSVLNPDNEVQLTEAANLKDTILNVSRILPWYEANALLTFNKTEMMQVVDWDPGTLQVVISEPVSTERDANTPLYLWATPLVVHVAANQGDTTLVLRTRYNILNGDVLTIPVAMDAINSLQELGVTLSQSAGSSGDSEFPFLFTVTLDKPLPLDLAAVTSQVYLRAYPGYTSAVLRLTRYQAGQLGPFLADYVASPLDSVPSYEEVFSLRTLNGGDIPIEGTTSSFITVPKNYPIQHRPIWAENLLFWQIKRGSGGFIYPNRYRLITDEEGLGRVATRIVPPLPSGGTWTFKVQAGGTGKVRVYTDPYGYADYSVMAHATSVITLTTPPGGQINRIEFLAQLDIPGAEVVIADSIFQGQVASQIQYTMVFKVLGETNFQSTSLIIKPYFLSLSDMSAQYDEGQTYNSGLIYR